MRTKNDKHAVRSILTRFSTQIAVTQGLVLLEAVSALLLPLFVGHAVDGLTAGDHTGLAALAALGAAALAVGAGRRVYDTRAYTQIYATVAQELVEHENLRGTSVSTVSARTSMLTELVSFLEDDLPGIVTNSIGLVGVLVIVAAISPTVAVACLALTVLIGVVYAATGRWNYQLNAGYNDQLEQQVSALETRQAATVREHLRALVRWRVRLSDLETANFSAVFLGAIALMVFAPVAAVGDSISAGQLLSLMMYVFQFIETVIALPLFAQQAIRLHEIAGRLGGNAAAQARSATATVQAGLLDYTGCLPKTGDHDARL